MVWVRALAGLSALAVVSSTALAFQEQQQAVPKATEGAAPTFTAPLAPDPTAVAKGTTVRIPGLGTLGVIPKMDFGLELLYGAADSPSKRIESGKSENNDDVMIRGSIKHKW